MSMEDRIMVDAMLAGDARSFQQFIDRYLQRIAAFVRRRSALDPADVEDIVQNTLIRALRSLRLYRGESSLLTWLCSIAYNELIDQHRRNGRRVSAASFDDPAVRLAALRISDPAPQPQDLQLAPAGESADVAVVLGELPENYALALEWKYGDDASVEDIGRQLGIGSTAAQSLLARARRAFRHSWQQRFPSRTRARLERVAG